jgi:hypothetical protein
MKTELVRRLTPSHLSPTELSLARERVNRRHDDHIDIGAGLVPISGAIELDPDEIEDYPPNALGLREEVSN